MLTFRHFRNTDPPIIASLWQSQAGQFGYLQPVSVNLFEQLVFAKLYFDYPGLILAFDGERPVGFAHAGFGPNDQINSIETAMGSTCLIVATPDCARDEVASGLLERCEKYLRSRGAETLYGGCLHPLNPFYLGLYGGSELPGILDSDGLMRRTFEGNGYSVIGGTRGWMLDLQRFEAVIDRRQFQIRRQMVVEVLDDAPTENWWDACTLNEFDLIRYVLVPRSGVPIATATFRSMSPAGANGFGAAVGLIAMEVHSSQRRNGFATFVLSEAFRQFQKKGVATVEVQTMADNEPAANLYEKLGFQACGTGKIFRKEATK